MALINAVRGGHFGGALLPGHPRYWMTAAVFALAFAVLPLTHAALFAAGFLLWSLPPWGHLIGLGRYAPDRPPSRLEEVLLWCSAGCVHGALWVRHWLILPMVFAVSWSPWALVLAPAIAMFIVLAYELGWRLTPSAPIRTAEVIAGAVLGLLLASCAPDVNAYYVKGGSTGPIHCKGSCP
jgi:hypothetical protein